MSVVRIGDVFPIEIYPERCCEVCDEIIHNHFDCPACEKNRAGSDAFGELEEEETEITCVNCETKFERVSDHWYYDCKVKVASFAKARKEGKA